MKYFVTLADLNWFLVIFSVGHYQKKKQKTILECAWGGEGL
jgi:hypothetical protein